MSQSINYCMFQITNYCDHKCSFCYAESFERSAEPDIIVLKDIASRLSESAIQSILLLGGDPAKYSKLAELARHITNLGMKLKIQ